VINPSEKELKLLHLSKYPPRQGGMDKLLRLHANNKESVYGLLRHKNLRTMGFSTNLPFFLQRSALERLSWISESHDVSIYYNCWGADLFSGYDRAPLRIGYIHNHFPNFENYIQHFAPYLDGFFTVNPATTKTTREILTRTHPPKNIQTIHLPIDPPNPIPVTKKRNVIGLVGRINYEQKRYDRLPEFAKLLTEIRPEMRIEVMGDGPKKYELIRRTNHLENISYLPWTVGNAYWKTLSSWKYTLFLSDYEGLPISLLESIQAGCIPIYPDLHSGNKQELPIELYPNDDFHAAIKLMSNAIRRKDEYIYTSPIEYLNACKRAIKKVLALRKIKSSPLLENSLSYNKKYKRLSLYKGVIVNTSKKN
jgi:glycosyltransferase involved in cell wall biosynthesis